MGDAWDEIERKKRKADLKQFFLDMFQAQAEARVEFNDKVWHHQTKEMVIICEGCRRLCFGKIEFEVHTCRPDAGMGGKG